MTGHQRLFLPSGKVNFARDDGWRSRLTKCHSQPFILEYAKQKAGDLTEAHQRAINYYRLNLKERPWQTKDDVAEYLEVFYHWCELEQYASAFDILRVCDEFLTLRGYNTTRVELYGQLVREWNLDKSEWQFTASLTSLGNAYQSLGQYQQAIACHQQHLEIAREIGARGGEAISLGNLGNTYQYLGQYQQAIDYHQQHLKIAREIGARGGEANAWFNSGITLAKLGQKSEAITAYQNARELYQAMGLDANIQNCDNAVEHLSRKSRPWVSLPKALAKFLLRWMHQLWQAVRTLTRR